MSATVRRVDRSLMAVVDHYPDDCVIETLTGRVAADWCAVVECGAVTTNTNHDLGDHINVTTQE